MADKQNTQTTKKQVIKKSKLVENSNVVCTSDSAGDVTVANTLCCDEGKCDVTKCTDCKCCEPKDNDKKVTESKVEEPADFSDISLGRLPYNDKHKIVRGTASQVVAGLKSMSDRTGEGNNDYQKVMYPALKKLTAEIVEKYVVDLLTVESDMQKQVVGANLNGVRNDGKLNFHVKINTAGVQESLSYAFAQFGQLLRVLMQRLKFIADRDPTSVKRYLENKDECFEFVVLQGKVKKYLEYLDTVFERWNDVVNKSCKAGGIVKEKKNYKKDKKHDAKPEDVADTKSADDKKIPIEVKAEAVDKVVVVREVKPVKKEIEPKDIKPSRTVKASAPTVQSVSTQQDDWQVVSRGVKSASRGRGRGRGNAKP